VVICLERCVDLHMAQLMPLPLIISCSNKIQIGFTFLVPALLGSPGQRAVKRVCVCVCVDQITRQEIARHEIAGQENINAGFRCYSLNMQRYDALCVNQCL